MAPGPYYNTQTKPAHLLIYTSMALTNRLYLLPHSQIPPKYSLLKHALLFGKAE